MLLLTQHNIVHPQVILIFVFMFAAGVAVVGFPWVLMGELATSNNLKVRNLCTRMTNGNENENRFLGERSYFFSIEVLFVISKEEYITNYNTGSLIHPISLCSTKPFPFSIYWISSDRLFVL